MNNLIKEMELSVLSSMIFDYFDLFGNYMRCAVQTNSLSGLEEGQNYAVCNKNKFRLPYKMAAVAIETFDTPGSNFVFLDTGKNSDLIRFVLYYFVSLFYKDY